MNTRCTPAGPVCVTTEVDMNIPTATLAIPEPVVIPESVDQCYKMLGRDNVIGLGDYAREAGFEEAVLITPVAIRRMVGEAIFDGPPERLIPAIVNALRELRATMRRYPGRQTLVLMQQDDDGLTVEVLVRQNMTASPPYTLVTLR